MRINARRVLLFGLVGTMVLCCGGGGFLAYLYDQQVLDTTGTIDFAHPVAIPPLAPSQVDANGRRVFELTAQSGSRDFGRGVTSTLGYSGSYLGPTLRATRGEQVVVNVHNALSETTTLHWHGMHLPAKMDGGPHQPIAPGATWSPTWQVNQPAATLWYHPHPHGTSADQVYKGLAGMFIVDDPGTSVAALPHEYGVDDFPLIVQDKDLGDGLRDGVRGLLGGVGTVGSTIMVNGTLAPYLSVTTTQVRLRLLNGSNARSYGFAFDDGRAFALVGTDGGLLPAPHETTRVTLSPGERAEVVVTARPGERTVLRSLPADLGLNGITARFTGGADTLDILQLRAADSLTPSPAIPGRLVDVPRIDPTTAVQSRQFGFADGAINGQSMDATRIDAAVVKDTVESWTIVNNDGTPHNFHLHDVQFQVAAIGGQEPPPELRGWKDTVYLRPHTPYQLVMRFTDYVDPDSPYMFHCHLLYHEDSGMMGQFVVVEPGGTPGTLTDHTTHAAHTTH